MLTSQCGGGAPISSNSPKSTVKLVRPGFGPATELPTFSASATASRRLQFASRCFSLTAATVVPRGFGTWALAVQLRR